ncbi:uncharacterized protein LOC122951088 isoform X2 [Acropora millepora]|uniref:uncharacterized protein LOC122951088 isoform X2 n=1 Tax=Acropora millepora TaxID=45264 RepID=UPI001CF26B26|nr:uncharacterized protein LOC122951088 isoform X2 [Acropora millepora]
MPSQKRKNTSSSMNSKNKKTCGLEEKRDDEEFTPLEIKIKRLQEKRPMKEDFKIRVWAKMLINGNHKSEDDTPHFPFFTGRKAGVRKRDCAVSASKDVSSAQSTSTVTSNNDKMLKRGAIIQQLKDIKLLKDNGILSTDEFNKERDKLVTELEKL